MDLRWALQSLEESENDTDQSSSMFSQLEIEGVNEYISHAQNHHIWGKVTDIIPISPTGRKIVNRIGMIRLGKKFRSKIENQIKM